MSGTLTVPTVLNNLGQGNQFLSIIDGDFSAITVYVNAREITVDVAANRPAFGVKGRYYFATDTSGGTLYQDTGSAWQQIAPGLTQQVAVVPQCLVGLTLSNDSGTPNTILDVAAGAASSDDATIANRIIMTMGALTGTTGGTWVVGTGQPKLDAGTVGNNQTWHVFVIERVDTLVVDILFSLSATAPTMPTNYTKKRRVGAFRTSGAAAIIPFVQDGDYFRLKTSVLDVNTNNPGTAAVTATLASVITGVRVFALVNWMPRQGDNSQVTLYVSDLDANDEAPSTTAAPLASIGENFVAVGQAAAEMRTRTNTSAQVRYRLSLSSAATDIRAATLGWIDRRGQDA